uniref:Uncharacterized protein n=1 Tax=Nymphaea colorata TaxID=210225 RepID=A0A5K0VBX0_9MAGN
MGPSQRRRLAAAMAVVGVLFCTFCIQPLEGSRPLDEMMEKRSGLLLESLPKGSDTGSGPSCTTTVPGGGSRPCALQERHFAGGLRHRPAAQPAYPSEMIKFGTASADNDTGSHEDREHPRS